MNYRLLRLVRIFASAFALAVLAAGLTWPALMLPVVGPWLAKIQLGPAVIHFSLFIFVVWLLITLIFGRVYCSTVCPIGTLQDIAARIPRLTAANAEKRHYNYRAPLNKLRFAILIAAVLLTMTGFSLLPSLIEPFADFERICGSFFHPLAQIVERMLESLGIHSSSAPVIITASATGSIIATLIFTIIVLVAAHSGRTLCNTACPIGTALGCVSRGAVLQMDIDTDLCTQCGKCRDVCKASCINLTDHTIDGSRCVVCFDCADVCPNKAMRYTWQRKQLSTPLMQRIPTLGREQQPEATFGGPTSKQTPINETVSRPSDPHF